MLAIVTSGEALASGKNRAVWFWRSHAVYGSDVIVGNVARETAAIAFFEREGIKKVYGSYGNRTVSSTEAAKIAAWNVRLHAAGIESQFLMSENTWIFPSKRSSLLTKITDRLANFNNAAGRLPEEKFDGLHLDIEPQALDDEDDGVIDNNGWSDITDVGRRDYLFLLRDTYDDVRSHVDSVVEIGFPVYADLPVWFDNLSGSIGWTNSGERDLWFDTIAVDLTGITLMPFERDTFSSIDSGVSWELSNITGASVRVALEADVGDTWSDVVELQAMMNQVESAYGISRAVDIQSYALYRAAMPILELEAAPVSLAWSGGGGEIDIEIKPAVVHYLYSSIDLCHWQLLKVYAPVEQQRNVREIVTLEGERQFWRVLRETQ